jgi:hypothetical protein
MLIVRKGNAALLLATAVLGTFYDTFFQIFGLNVLDFRCLGV